jgi:hypothetical protein
MVRRRTPDNDYIFDPSLTPIHIQERIAREKAEQLAALAPIPPVEADTTTDNRPKREPVLAIHLILQERYDNYLISLGSDSK